MNLQDEAIKAGHADTYRTWALMRIQDWNGRGQGRTATVPDWIVKNGEGVFWEASTKYENVVFLFHPSRVLRELRTEAKKCSL